MTTISNSRRKKRLSPGVFFLMLFVILLALAAFFFRTPGASVLWSVLSPVLHAREQGAVALGDFFAGFSSGAVLATENRELKEELASTTALLLDRNFLYTENLALKARLGRSENTEVVLATVIMRPPGVPYDTQIIDVGRKSGIKEGDLVAAEGSAYIGRVASVYESTSRVILFSASGQTYQALLRGTIPIALSGQGGGSITGELPVGTDIAVGDFVLLPNISPEFMAQVSAVMQRDGESFQSVYLQLPVNPLELRFVEVHRSAN